MNTTQAANCCGQAKQQYSRAFLISRFALTFNANKLHRAIRKTIWQYKIWNFNRFVLFNRLTKLRVAVKRKWPSILLTNARSLKNKLDEAKEFVINNKCDVCVFCESWFNNSIPHNMTSISNYNQFRLDRIERNGGGIVVYVKNSIAASIVSFNNRKKYEILPLLLLKTGSWLFVSIILFGKMYRFTMMLSISYILLFHLFKNHANSLSILFLLVI